MNKKVLIYAIFVLLVGTSIAPTIYGINESKYNITELKENKISNNLYIKPVQKTLIYDSTENVKYKNNLDNRWYKTFGGKNFESGDSVNQTNDGGFILTGYTQSYGAGFQDVWLIKTDSNGEELWNKTYGGPNSEIGCSIQQTTEGGFIITGYHQINESNIDFYLIKTDENGNEEWNKTYGGINLDWAYSVKQTSDEGFIIAGYTWSYGNGSADGWLVKTDDEGKELWNKTYGDTGFDTISCIQQTQDGGFIFTGGKSFEFWLVKTDVDGNITWEITKSDLLTGNSVLQTSEGDYVITGKTNPSNPNGYLIKISNDGNELWKKIYSETYEGYSVCEIQDGGYGIASLIVDMVFLDSDVYLIKTDTNGNKLWSTIFGSKNSELVSEIKQTNDGGFIVIGDSLKFDPIEFDIFLIKTNEYGIVNYPPNKTNISGPNNGIASTELEYSFKSEDPESNDLYYFIDWGDGTYDDWLGSYSSGEEFFKSHIWYDLGTFYIKVKVIDEYKGESDWSDSYEVTIIDNIKPKVEILKPQRGIYLFNNLFLKRFFLPALIIGKITIEVNAIDNESGIDRVEFYINGIKKSDDTTYPYSYDWKWNRPRLFHFFIIKVIAYDKANNSAIDRMIVHKFL